ncbi:hypothetical protein RRG08_003488 [Elysia crispata]|uniref:Uncharacterized protein n=1 Tax=Elysia crispata TaxID=231223 RepID=A0AAE0Y6H5_9GAST|nr:hypothetical protein RRG08_003488 [Elysia crispata]
MSQAEIFFQHRLSIRGSVRNEAIKNPIEAVPPGPAPLAALRRSPVITAPGALMFASSADRPTFVHGPSSLMEFPDTLLRIQQAAALQSTPGRVTLSEPQTIRRPSPRLRVT